jgi:hypothetical protein
MLLAVTLLYAYFIQTRIVRVNVKVIKPAIITAVLLLINANKQELYQYRYLQNSIHLFLKVYNSGSGAITGVLLGLLPWPRPNRCQFQAGL